MADKFKIVRFYHPRLKKPNKLIRENVTLEAAQKHCNDPRTQKKDRYFDGYQRM